MNLVTPPASVQALINGNETTRGHGSMGRARWLTKSHRPEVRNYTPLFQGHILDKANQEFDELHSIAQSSKGKVAHECPCRDATEYFLRRWKQ